MPTGLWLVAQLAGCLFSWDPNFANGYAEEGCAFEARCLGLTPPSAPPPDTGSEQPSACLAYWSQAHCAYDPDQLDCFKELREQNEAGTCVWPSSCYNALRACEEGDTGATFTGSTTTPYGTGSTWR